MMDERDRLMLIGAGLISTIVTVAFCAACVAPYLFEVKTGNRELISNMFSGLMTAFGGVVGFWTGPVINRILRKDEHP
jgi:hypothetical protein